MLGLPISAVLVLTFCNYVGTFKAIAPGNDGELDLSKKFENEGWTYFEKSHKFYKAFIEQTIQPEAKQRCRDKGGQLATIHSWEEDNLIYSLIRESDPAVYQLTYDAHFWIGMQKSRGSDYRWLDGSPTDYTNWGSGEPSDRSEPSRTRACQIATLLSNSAVLMDSWPIIFGILTAICQLLHLDVHDCFRVRIIEQLAAWCRTRHGVSTKFAPVRVPLHRERRSTAQCG
ncbi:unnamed protein product [Nippostrongylus brasiliensis]|uniref:C-type lectin domain-containing protein n=1 Tax=Nippostrongylus brasiliensis TaxID=27835 RepID=A0A0N4XGE4_NIPBR|nr:unnamed protein product [Nippostrongylus brasiliensis]